MEQVKELLHSCKKLLDSKCTIKDIYDFTFANSGNAFMFFDDKKKAKTISYAKTKKNIEKYAKNITLLCKDIKKGSIIVFKLSNCYEWCELFYAILMAGYKPLLIDAKTSKVNTINLINQSNAKAVLTDDPFFYPVKKLFFDDIVYFKQKGEFVPSFENEVIFCSSGTTGAVKLMVFNGENLVNQIVSSYNMGEETDNIMYPGDIRILAMIPFHHIFGFVAVFLWYTFYGKTIVFPSSLNSKEIQEICVNNKITHLYSVPLYWDSLAKQYNRMKEMNINGSSKLLGDTVKFCISGGGYLSKETSETINKLGYELHNGFGMTEIGVTSVDLSKDINERMKCSIGKPLYGVSYKIQDNELLVSSPTIHVKEIIDGEIHDTQLDDGYFHTADIAEVGENDEYYIKGRMKDIIINADGENIFPDELELYFKDIKGVVAYSILGIKSQKDALREEIAFVGEVLPNEVNLASIKAQIEEMKLPKGTKIEKVYFTEKKLPTANNLKIKRNEIKKAIESGSSDYFDFVKKDEVKAIEYDQETTTNIVEPLREIFAKVLYLPIEKVLTNSHWINDLGGDSMNYFELVTLIEGKFNIVVPQEKYIELNCIDDYVKLIKEAK